MFKRPSNRETEADLLQQQKDFLKSKNKENEVEEKPETTENVPPPIETVGIIGNIVEKNHDHAVQFTESTTISEGFPTMFRIDPGSKWTSNSKKKKSLFAQKLGKTPALVEEPQTTYVEPVHNHQDIHEENLQKIQNMTKEQIMDETKSLQETLNPDLLNFLKNRGSRKQQPLKTPETNETQHPIDTDTLKQNLLKTIDKEYLEMDKIEPEKLQWIGDIPDASSLQPGETYSARFNFTGDLQPFTTEIDVRTSLHHHGEEPQRPGYTIQELYQLSRSTVLQQRILALNTLANIIRKTKMGYYDSCFDGVLLKKLVDSDLFFLLRFSLDDRTTIPAAVNCLHELFVSRSDEVCLDRLVNFSLDNCEPFLYIAVETDNDTREDELKDEEIISQDLVRGVLRTDLLVRFSYILQSFEPDPITVSKIFDIVTRVCRHSPGTCENVYYSDIMRHVLSNVNSNQVCHNSVKLLRVLASSSAVFLHSMSEKFDFQFLLRIIDRDEPMFKLKLECLALWRLFLRNNLLTVLFKIFTPCFGRLLSFYVAKVDIVHGRFDFELFSGIVSVLNAVMLAKNPVDSSYEVSLKICLEKWLTQLVGSNGIMNYSVAKALGAVLNFFTIKFGQNFVTSDLVLLKKLSILNKLVDNFEPVVRNLIQYSHISCRKNVNRDPENLPSLCSVYPDGENYLKVVHDESVWPFIEPFAEFLLKIYEISKDFAIPLARLKEKLDEFSQVFFSFRETNSWFSKYELGILLTTLKIKKKFGDDDVLQFAFRLIPYFRTDDERVLSVFNVISHEFVPNVFQNHLSKTLTKFHAYNCETFSRHWMYEPISVATQETLQCLTKILKNCPELLSNVSPSLRFCHICLVLLDGENIFIPDIRQNLETCFQDVLRNLDQLDLTNISISDKTFYELYRDLAIEYASCSYGDNLFAKIVTLPLCQRFDVSYRKLMWSEMMHALRVISLPKNSDFLSVDVFTTPVETDESLLILYLNAVSNNVLTENRNGFLYAVAVENVKKYLISSQRDEKVSSILNEKISKLKNECLKNYLLS